MPLSTITAASLLCLSSVIHWEARGEPTRGQIAVAEVVINRTKDKRFPDTICGVVKQRGQFSWYPKRPLTNKKKELARKVLCGDTEKVFKKHTPLFFTNYSVRFKGRNIVREIGRHIFYE